MLYRLDRPTPTETPSSCLTFFVQEVKSNDVDLVGDNWGLSFWKKPLKVLDSNWATGESGEMRQHDSSWVASLSGFKIGIVRATFQISGIARFEVDNSKTLAR